MWRGRDLVDFARLGINIVGENEVLSLWLHHTCSCDG